MKKIFCFCFILLFAWSVKLLANDKEKQYYPFNIALSAGYVFKHDCRFEEVYGRGMVNIITGDFCYFPWEVWGFGVKMSYWRAKGCTLFLNQRTILQEIPVTVYARRIKTFECGLQIYGSLGGGFAWVKEKSYLGKVRFYKGLGEIEVGLNSPVWHRLNLTLAVRYLFPPQCHLGDKVDVGGVDLRGGIGISF